MDALSRRESSDEERCARFILAHAILLSFPGVPAIYIQSILGSRNDYAGVKEKLRYSRAINRKKYHSKEITRELNDEATLRHAVYHELSRLITLRRSHNEFHPDNNFTIDTINSSVMRIQRSNADGNCLTGLFNVSKNIQHVNITNLHGRDLISKVDILVMETSCLTGRCGLNKIKRSISSIKSKIVQLSLLVSSRLISGCKEENKTNVSIEFMHSSVEQERQAVISKLIARFEKENPGITVKQVPVEEDAYNTKVITLSRSGSLPEVIETSHDYAKVMDKEPLIDRKAVATVISNVGEGAFYDGVLRIVRTEDGSAWTGVPVSAWIGGIWYRKDVLAKAGLEEPKNWQQLLDVAQKLNDPANKKYGIALPTAESVLTEQSLLPVCVYQPG